MKTITIEMSERAYIEYKKIADLENITPSEKLAKSVNWYEKNKFKPQMLEYNYKCEIKRIDDKKARKVHKTHPLQSYILDFYPNTKSPKRTISWRTCPIQPSTKMEKDHVGEYWYSIDNYAKENIAMFRHIKSSKMYYFKTLKALKRNINKRLGYDHYKVN